MPDEHDLDEQLDESLGVEQLPQDELEAIPQSDILLTPVDLEKPSANAVARGEVAVELTSSIDAEESRSSKQPKTDVTDASHRRIATD